MTRLLPTLELLAIAGAASAVLAAPASTPIRPGYWESTNMVSAPRPSKKVERRCISRAEVLAFMSGPSNAHYACEYPTRSIDGGRIELKGQCVDGKGQKIDVAGSGVYTPESFHLDAKIKTRIAGLPFSGKASTDAHRIAATCPAAAHS